MKHVIVVMMDGLRADQAASLGLPHLSRLRARGTSFAGHRAIFPSATRASSASVATGMFPARHGLHGNQMALRSAQGAFVQYDVGKPEFFDTWRRASGRTLRVPTLAERVAHLGGSIVYANASPGAALAHDPDGFGHVYHRAISRAPGRTPAPDPLEVTLSLDGDAAMTRRFVADVFDDRRPTHAVLWLGNPDDTQHDHPLGSPATIAAIEAADALLGSVIDAVERHDPTGASILLIAGSDHGHETVDAIVPVEAEMIAAGLKRDADDGALAVVPQGTGFMVYADAAEAARIDDVAGWLEGRDWCGRVVRRPDLGAIGHAGDGGIALAVGMASRDEANAHGVPGRTFVATRFDTTGRTLGNGSHGGLGAYETHPVLVIAGAGFDEGAVSSFATSLVDIAPTALAHLGLEASDLDGRPLQNRPN